MAGLKLDGAGVAKMTTLETAMKQVQRLHTVVELCGVAVKGNKPVSQFIPQIKRAGQPLVGLLKAQYGLISDQVAAFLLVSTRGGSNDQTRLRALREGVAQLRVQLELAIAKVLELHAVEKAHEG